MLKLISWKDDNATWPFLLTRIFWVASLGNHSYSNFSANLDLPSFIEERYSLRLMRHVYYLRPGLTIDDWCAVERLVRPAMKPQYVLTREELLEARVEHPRATKRLSVERRRAMETAAVESSVSIGAGNAGCRLIYQLSKIACVPKLTYGCSAAGVWVSGGCRGKFDCPRLGFSLRCGRTSLPTGARTENRTCSWMACVPSCDALQG